MSELLTQQSNNGSTDVQMRGILAKTGKVVAGAVVQRTRVAGAQVNPIIAPSSPIIVVVKKPHTRPARVKITLKTQPRTRRPGTLTRIKTSTSGNIRFFDAPKDGGEITFTPVAGSTTNAEHEFTANELNAEVHLFAESDTPHANLNDFRLRLSLPPGPNTGPAFEVILTAVELTLDICLPRTAPAPLPNPLAQPPQTKPATANPGGDKWFGGGALFAQDLPGKHNQRAQLIMQQVKPATFADQLVLRQVAISGDDVTFPDNHLQLFDRETVTPGEQAKTNPHEFASISPPLGFALFVEGKVPTGFRRAGFQLGIKNKELDGDRIAITVFRDVFTNNVAPFTTVIPRAQIEGILSTDRASFDLGDLFGTQPNSLFRARVEAPGLNPATQTITAALVSNSLAGTIDAIDPLTLTRTTPTSDVFLSRPILAMPMAILRNQVTLKSPQDIEVIMAQAGGKLSLQVKIATLTGLVGIAEATVRGRVVRMNINILNTFGANNAEASSAFALAQTTWAQAGIELQLRGPLTSQVDPGGLNNIQQLPNNFFNNIGPDRTRLFGLNPTPDIDVYFVNNIQGARGEAFGTNDLNPPMAGFVGNMMVARGTLARNTMSHELGHILIDLPRTVNAGGEEHSLFTIGAGGVLVSGTAAPTSNVMGIGDPVTRTDLTQAQVLRAQTNAFVRFVP